MFANFICWYFFIRFDNRFTAVGHHLDGMLPGRGRPDLAHLDGFPAGQVLVDRLTADTQPIDPKINLKSTFGQADTVI